MIFSRQAGLLPERAVERHRVSIYGAGAIGGYAALALSKMGLATTVYDFDTVETANLGPQLFRPSDVGQSKAVAAGNNPYYLGLVTGALKKVDVADQEATIHILAVDCMTTRRQVALTATPESLVVDIRMGGATGSMFAFIAAPRTKRAWLRTWFPPEQASAAPCTERATSWNAMTFAAHAARMAYLFIRGEMEKDRLAVFHGGAMEGSYSETQAE
jgi:hypothetical protein